MVLTMSKEKIRTIKMEKNEIIGKIIQKKQFSRIPMRDIEKVFEKFDNERYSDEEKIKFTRDLLRKTFSGFSGKKILVEKNKDADELLKRHLSTRERYPYYDEIYRRILRNLPKKICVIDLGAGINGLGYGFFSKAGKDVHYTGVEAIGQIVDIVNDYFEKNRITGEMVHVSLFELEKMKKLIKQTSKPRIIFLFKVIDSIEKIERDYTKTLLEEIVPFADRVVVSFATESWFRRKKFYANRRWFTDFVKERWRFTDDFEIGGERYLVFDGNKE